MRKIGYDSTHNKREGIKYADEQYDFLVFLQKLYDGGCLIMERTHSDNIIKEIWDISLKSPRPLGVINKNKEELYKELSKELLRYKTVTDFNKALTPEDFVDLVRKYGY